MQRRQVAVGHLELDDGLASSSSSMPVMLADGPAADRDLVALDELAGVLEDGLDPVGAAPPNIASATSAIATTSAAPAITRAAVEPRSESRGSRVLRSLVLESKRGLSTGASRWARQSAGPAAARLPGAVCHSIPRGPWASPERNWRTNWLSELNSSDAGPDSTILPFQSTAMKSATRRADMMSCVITL